MADRLDPAVATEPAPPLTADPEGEALTSTLGVSAVVRTLHELFGHPAGTLGLVIGQASNGPDRYRVMIPGNPHEYSLRGRDVEVVQGIERWYQRWSRERYWRELAGMLTTEVEHLREVAAHGQTLAVEVGALREEVEHLRGQRDADGCWWRDENVRLAARIAELCGERDAARVALGDAGDPPAPDTRPCRACGRPFSPTHDSSAPGPTVRHPYVPVPTRPVGGAGDPAPDGLHDAAMRAAVRARDAWRAAEEGPMAGHPDVPECMAIAAAVLEVALAARTATPPPAEPDGRTDWGVLRGGLVEVMPETRAREVAAERGGVVVRRQIAVTEWRPVADTEEAPDATG